MTRTFECDGCGSSFHVANIIAVLENREHAARMGFDYPGGDELCVDCYKATKQFLKDRYNNAKKGVNTGFSTTGTNWSPSNSVSCSSTSTGDLISFEPMTITTDNFQLTPEVIKDHKIKTGQVQKSLNKKHDTIHKITKKGKKRNVSKD